MEFWIGLSVGMHLGKILADYLEKFGVAYGLLSQETSKKLDAFEEATREIGAIIDEVAED
jgi:hypothetical protein